MATLERAIVKGLLGGAVQIRNMFVAEVALAGVDTDDNVWREYLQGVYEPMQPFLSSVFTTTSLEIQHRSGSSWETVVESGFEIPGQATGDAIANLVAAVLIGKAGGLRKMGRKFFSGWAESAVVGNTLSNTALTAMAGVLIAYISPFTNEEGSGLYPGILDKTGTYHEFVGGVVSSLLGSMRRRKPGLGI